MSVGVARARRWGETREQLTLSDAMGVSVEDMATPGRHVVLGDVRSVRRATDDGAFVVGSLNVAGCAAPVPFLGGCLAGARVGCLVELVGYWEEHQEYGVQFRAERLARLEHPRERDGLVRYLSANIDHLGPALSARLVDRFGVGVLDLLEADPERVREVLPGKLADRIVDGARAWAASVEDDRWARKLAPRLMMAADVGHAVAQRIVRFFRGSEVAELMLLRDPYRLLDVPGVGWQTADRIARSMGLPDDAEDRLEAAVSWALMQAMGHGHSALPRPVLRAKAVKLLGQDLGVDDAIDRSRDVAASLAEAGGLLYQPEVLWAEWRVADFLADLSRVRTPLDAAERVVIDQFISTNHLTPEQGAAVYNALECGVSILTGRPGTGKTHTQRVVVEACGALGRSVRVVAPTGKAAARASELTKSRAQTIHKLLGGVVGGQRAEGPLRGGVVVMDEASMCDVETFGWLAANVDVASGLHLVVVGDDQLLPSVGHGAVLGDMLRASVLPTVRLTAIQRQAAGSRITTNAHALLDGRDLDLSGAPDFTFVELPLPRGSSAPDAEDFLERAQSAVVRTVRQLILDEQRSLVRKAGLERRFDPLRDVQVLSPRNAGALGVDALNASLRPVMNPGASDGPRISGGFASVGDRVICTRNDYRVGTDGLMNGEQGVITAVTCGSTESVVVLLDDGRTVSLTGVQTYSLSHAFCTSVHRAQGSEYPYVVVCYHSSHRPMLDVRLLYTAITRARTRVILVGDREALELTRAAGGAASWRHTGLARHLREATGATQPSSAL